LSQLIDKHEFVIGHLTYGQNAPSLQVVP